MPTDTRREAIEYALARWARDQAQISETRDQLVRGAASAGIGKKRIHDLTGISRSTIDRILGGQS